MIVCPRCGKENQDHFLLCTLHRTIRVHSTSLPDRNLLQTNYLSNGRVESQTRSMTGETLTFSYPAAQRTKCADARACSPFLLGITTSAK